MQSEAASTTRAGALFVSAAILLAACSTISPFTRDAQSSSCAAPMIVLAPQPLVTRKLSDLAGGEVVETDVPACTGVFEGVRTYKVVGGRARRIYAVAMTLAEAQAHPNVQCAPRFRSFYQPPLSLGGAGRVVQLPDGTECSAITNPSQGPLETLFDI